MRDKHHHSHCQNAHSEPKTQTRPGQFSPAMTNWRSLQSLIAPGSFVRSWCPTLHTSRASHCARFPAAPRTCNLISRVSVSKPAGARPVNWTADVTLKKKSLFHYRVLLSVNLLLGLEAGGLIRSHGGIGSGGVLQCRSLRLIGSSGVMVMSCVVCLFRLKVISFVAFFLSAFSPRSIKLITVLWLQIGKGEEGRDGGGRGE